MSIRKVVLKSMHINDTFFSKNLPENQNSVYYMALSMLLLHTFYVVETYPSTDII